MVSGKNGGGQGFYRDAPLLLMDEPSSALDAASELQMIKSLQQLSSNKTAVIVSHRLTTIQWADLIYLFHEGEIVESGDHKELMDLKGKYYNLFQMLTATNSDCKSFFSIFKFIH